MPTLSELPTGAAEESPTASGAALTGATPTLNPEIGVARRFLYQFRFGTRAVFDDNISLNPDTKDSDEFFVLNAGVTLGLGDPTGAGNFLRFEYSPDASFYISNTDNNALQHTVGLTGSYQFSKLTISGRLGVQILDGTDVTTLNAVGAQSTQANLDVNGRTKLNLYTLQGNLRYSLTDKTSFSASAQYSRNDYEVLLSSQNLGASFYADYAYSPKLTFGAGTNIGRTLSDPPTPDQTYYQISLRTNYEVSGKVSIAGNAGIEARLSDGSDSTEVGPVFDINAIYLPFDGTSVSLSTGRRVTPSAVQGGQSFETLDFSVSLRQRFFGRYFVSLTAGYQNSRYVSQLSGINASREDNYFYVQPGLDFVIHRNVTVGLNYLHRESKSTATGAGFDDNQVSIGVSISF